MKMKETTTRGQARKDDRPREGRLWEVIDKNQIEGCKGYWRASQLEYCGAGWTGANATCAEGVRAVRRRGSNCAICAKQSLVRGTRSSRHGSHLDRFALRAKSPSLIGTALYGAVRRVVWDRGANYSPGPDWVLSGSVGLSLLLYFADDTKERTCKHLSAPYPVEHLSK